MFMLFKNLVLNYASSILFFFLWELGKDDINFILMPSLPTNGDTAVLWGEVTETCGPVSTHLVMALTTLSTSLSFI